MLIIIRIRNSNKNEQKNVTDNRNHHEAKTDRKNGHLRNNANYNTENEATHAINNNTKRIGLLSDGGRGS